MPHSYDEVYVREQMVTRSYTLVKDYLQDMGLVRRHRRTRENTVAPEPVAVATNELHPASHKLTVAEAHGGRKEDGAQNPM